MGFGGCVLTICLDIFCREERRSTTPNWLGFNIGVICGNTKRICQHPQEVSHRPWAMKVTSIGAKACKDASKKASDRCRSCSKKQGGSRRRMRYCEFKCLHQAFIAADNRGAKERTPSRTRRQHTLEMQSSPRMNTVYGLMKDPHQPIARHWTKAWTPLVSHKKGDVIRSPNYRIQYVQG